MKEKFFYTHYCSGGKSYCSLKDKSGFNEIQIVTGSERPGEFMVSVTCFVKGADRAPTINSKWNACFYDSLNELKDIVRCLAVADLKSRNKFLDLVMIDGPILNDESAPVVPASSAPSAPPREPSPSPSPAFAGEGRGEGSESMISMRSLRLNPSPVKP
jgi:hypothetical protein